MQLYLTTLIFIFGLIVGSFLSAFTYRTPRGESVNKGRSKCPKCGKKINWYDNIPLLSYLILGGKCRNCGKRISFRYPLIELGTALTFTFVYFLGGSNNGSNSVLFFILNLILVTILLGILIIDMEHQLIPDGLTFTLIFVVFILRLSQENGMFFASLFSGFAASTFFLLLHLFTKGKGMGLGDVKLAVVGGIYFGPLMSVSWIFVSILLGAVVGLILLPLGKAKFGKPIPFGPFMVAAFFLMMFWGDKITQVLFPYF